MAPGQPGSRLAAPADLAEAQLAQSRRRLSAAEVTAAALADSALYTSVEVVARTGSTNADLLAAARAGAPAGSVLVAEEQTAGRGRLDRRWQSAPGTALTFSMLLRPAAVPPARRGWLPLLTGVAVVAALSARVAAVSLKWPNDVLANSGKLAGILAEQTGDGIVVGIGLNVGATREQLPSEHATSLWLAGAVDLNRQAILLAVLREFERWYQPWAAEAAAGDADASGVRAAYVAACATLGRDVRVELPGGRVLVGLASDVDAAGRLLVSAVDGVHAISAGDVIHVR